MSHRILLCLLTLTVALSACTTSQERTSEQPYSILEQGEPVPLVAGQGLSLSRRLNWEMSTASLEQLEFYTIETYDLKGYPFITMVLTAPVQSPDV